MGHVVYVGQVMTNRLYLKLTKKGYNMTKKQIAEYIIIFILGVFVTVSVINPISKEYTIWNVIYKTKDLYN